jgi:hypothetical protein
MKTSSKQHLEKNNGYFQLLWSVHSGEGPLFATALHAGHQIRNELAGIMALEESLRLREEVKIAKTQST